MANETKWKTTFIPHGKRPVSFSYSGKDAESQARKTFDYNRKQVGESKLERTGPRGGWVMINHIFKIK